MKNWSFNTCAIGGFALSAFAVALLIANALTGNVYLTAFISTAAVALILGGAFSVRAHVLWSHDTKR
ncbi:hypothetical protein [Cryobacterium sp. CG_9.6]|uniref:hypothetical protein n=1 Tax=Cryobacterium sp. CG_9.6 TaxID=2760710 RepID=UPI0024761F58|nr:hypothetical protein [Cryobacterium sp. CG_9.6]MDH6236313.1 membrane protein implicated in regulation of membrane protease activity [Cryobacterium sp. CG_9.6]